MLMWLVRRLPLLVFLTVAACASHAERLARRATTGVKAEITAMDPSVAKDFGVYAGRGAVSGALGELTSAQNQAMVRAILAATSQAAARGVSAAMSADTGKLQQLFDLAGTSALNGFSRSLETNAALRDQISQMSHQVAASAVYGARDALADAFPECSGTKDWRRCLDQTVADMSRTAARGMMAGFISAAKMPILAFTFLAGVLATLLVGGVMRAVARTRAPEHHHPRQA
jgi:hypothetical protein